MYQGIFLNYHDYGKQVSELLLLLTSVSERLTISQLAAQLATKISTFADIAGYAHRLGMRILLQSSLLLSSVLLSPLPQKFCESCAMFRKTVWKNTVSDAVSWHQDEALNTTIFILKEYGPTGFLLKEEGEPKNFKVGLHVQHPNLTSSTLQSYLHFDTKYFLNS